MLVDVRRAAIPWYEEMRYPADWREKTLNRKQYGVGEYVEIEANMLATRQLQTRQDLDLSEMPLGDVIKYLRKLSGVNINVNWGELANVGIDSETTVETEPGRDISVAKALELVLRNVSGEMAEILYVIEDGVVSISTREELNSPQRRRTQVYDIQDLLVSIPDTSPGELGIGDGGGGGGGDSEEEGETISESREHIMALIKELVEPESWQPEGDVGSMDTLSGKLVITHTPETHRKVLDLLNQLRDVQVLQVSIEWRTITITTGCMESIGLDFDMWFRWDAPLRAFGGNNWRSVNGQWNPNDVYSDIPFINTSSDNFTDMVGRSSLIGGVAEVGSAALTTGFAFWDNDIHMELFLEATQAAGTTRQLSAPRVTLTNGQKGYISKITERSYVSELNITNHYNDDGDLINTDFDPTVEDIAYGVVFPVRPVVSADRRYVTLTLNPEISTLDRLDQVSYGAAGFITLPTWTTTSLSTTVSVPDGGTLVLGGLKQSAEVEREKGVPLLSKIPIIQRLFDNRGSMHDEEVLLLLIKPTIIIQKEEERRAFP